MEVTIVFSQAGFLMGPLGDAGGSMSRGQLVMLALAVGGLAIVMVSTYNRNRRSRLAPRGNVREKYQKLDHPAGATHDVGKVMLELDQLARQIYGRIDTRFAKLEAVIRDADQRIATLTRLAGKSTGGSGVDVTLESQKPRVPESLSDLSSDHRHNAIYRMADGAMSPADIARDTGKTQGEIELILALRKTRLEAACGSGGAT